MNVVELGLVIWTLILTFAGLWLVNEANRLYVRIGFAEDYFQALDKRVKGLEELSVRLATKQQRASGGKKGEGK